MENETINQQSDPAAEARRKFLKAAIAALTFASGVVIGLPFIRTVIRSAPVKKARWSEAGKLSAIPVGIPTSIKFHTFYEDAYVRESKPQTAWVVKQPDNKVTVFSPVCTHLGCYFKWDRDTERFECPCHGSIFSINGSVLGGPAPRPLDTLPYEVNNDTLFVRWEEYKSGMNEKIQI